MGGKKPKRNPNIDRFIRHGEMMAYINQTARLLNLMVEVYEHGGGNAESDEIIEDMLLDIRDVCLEIVHEK